MFFLFFSLSSGEKMDLLKSVSSSFSAAFRVANYGFIAGDVSGSRETEDSPEEEAEEPAPADDGGGGGDVDDPADDVLGISYGEKRLAAERAGGTGAAAACLLEFCCCCCCWNRMAADWIWCWS